MIWEYERGLSMLLDQLAELLVWERIYSLMGSSHHIIDKGLRWRQASICICENLFFLLNLQASLVTCLNRAIV